MFDDQPKVLAEEIARREREWGGWYDSNDWQRVTDVDAWALSMALSRAAAALESGVKLSGEQERLVKAMESEIVDDNLKIVRRPVDPNSLKWLAEYISKGGFEIG